jgi:hypothetical protein
MLCRGEVNSWQQEIQSNMQRTQKYTEPAPRCKVLLVAKLRAWSKEKGELAAPSNRKLPQNILGLVVGFYFTSST